jgi:RHS repeat-associated protein
MPNPGDGGPPPGGGPAEPGGGESGLGYDANGNLTTYKGWTYTYDAQNRLTSASNGTTSAEFYYDGKNRQIARNINGVIRFSAWDGWELVEEYAGGLQRTEGYLQGATGVIKTLVSNICHYQDKLGSTTHVANASGALLESYRYDLYGTPSYFNSTSQPINASTVGIADLYAGERWIPELGLYDLRNRFMSPELGRFLQPDPIGFKGDAANLYRYCGNDPIDRTDPAGLTDLNYVGGDDYKDWNLRYALDHYFNPKDVISVGAHAGPTSMTNTTVRPHAPLTATQVVRDIANLDKAKSNAQTRIRLYMCRAGDWREAAKEGKLCPAQEIANQSRRKVEATGAWINPRNETKWPTDTCPDTSWYEFSPNAAEPKRIDDPTGFRRGGGSSDNLGNGESIRSTRPAYDAFGSTTLEAARWENSYGYGGWFQIEKNLGR